MADIGRLDLVISFSLIMRHSGNGNTVLHLRVNVYQFKHALKRLTYPVRKMSQGFTTSDTDESW